MGILAPFLYDAPKREGSRSPVYEFDPRAASRICNTPRTPRPKVDGPLISFNQESNSYLFLSKNKSHTKQMGASVKKNVIRAKIIIITLRYIQLLCSCTLVGTGFVTNLSSITTAWLIRLAPGIAVAHTAYALYHLSYKASERIPASAASYALFASILDSAIVPVYIFIATVLAGQAIDQIPPTPGNPNFQSWLFYKVGFYFAIAGSSIYLVSLALSLYLASVFRQIAMMPPDMNPLEDNLTSRHKRNKSSITTASLFGSPKLTTFESKRSSAISDEDYEKTSTSPSSPAFIPENRDARQDLPSMKYAVPSRAELKRSSGYTASPSIKKHVFSPAFKKHVLSPSLKKPSYIEISPSDEDESMYRESLSEFQPQQNLWYAGDSLSKEHKRAQGASHKKGNARYAPSHQKKVSIHDHPNPLKANPLSFSIIKESSIHSSPRSPNRNYVLSPTSETRNGHLIHQNCNTSIESGDIGEASLDIATREIETQSLNRSPRYGELNPGKLPLIVERNVMRQVSSGHDYAYGDWNSRGLGRREVSGEIAEEGRCGEGGLNPLRLRKFSGKLLI